MKMGWLDPIGSVIKGAGDFVGSIGSGISNLGSSADKSIQAAGDATNNPILDGAAHFTGGVVDGAANLVGAPVTLAGDAVKLFDGTDTASELNTAAQVANPNNWGAMAGAAWNGFWKDPAHGIGEAIPSAVLIAGTLGAGTPVAAGTDAADVAAGAGDAAGAGAALTTTGANAADAANLASAADAASQGAAGFGAVDAATSGQDAAALAGAGDAQPIELTAQQWANTDPFDAAVGTEGQTGILSRLGNTLPGRGIANIGNAFGSGYDWFAGTRVGGAITGGAGSAWSGAMSSIANHPYAAGMIGSAAAVGLGNSADSVVDQQNTQTQIANTHVIAPDYDGKGNNISVTTKGTLGVTDSNGNPVKNLTGANSPNYFGNGLGLGVDPNGYAAVTGANGKPITNAQGDEIGVDPAGNLIKMDKNGKPVVDAHGNRIGFDLDKMVTGANGKKTPLEVPIDANDQIVNYSDNVGNALSGANPYSGDTLWNIKNAPGTASGQSSAGSYPGLGSNGTSSLGSGNQELMELLEMMLLMNSMNGSSGLGGLSSLGLGNSGLDQTTLALLSQMGLGGGSSLGSLGYGSSSGLGGLSSLGLGGGNSGIDPGTLALMGTLGTGSSMGLGYGSSMGASDPMTNPAALTYAAMEMGNTGLNPMPMMISAHQQYLPYAGPQSSLYNAWSGASRSAIPASPIPYYNAVA